ncbi:hypothetical protein GCM10011351_11990 [Paraliobacillus quinghaiensis]|uniref:BD-FAE-like domain-containing protein n=1 Tax=Paraliobacillus quinghaiensis TaxID=470815 RepID=A0A917WTN3_9BACI|nr:alpha/beta hydrolase [Paraliobacillus quinghaiensis]GGM27713.1 hypothetical protein GCM10011351_11990 [Paraliobacillus quinghaiensis]
MSNPMIQRQPNFFSSPKRSFTTTFSTVVLIANLLALTLGIIYFIIDVEHFLGNILGYLMAITLIGNILIALIPRENKGLDYFYLILSVFAMSIVPIMNTIASLDVTNQSSRSIVSVILLMSLFLLGAIIAAKKKSSDYERSFFSIQYYQKKHTYLKVTSSILVMLLLVLGIYVSYVLLTGKSGGFIEMSLPGYLFFFSISTLAIVAIFLKIRTQYGGSLLNLLVTITGLSIAIIFSLPLFFTIFSLDEMETDFSDAFGVDWGENISENVEEHFATIPFSLTDYFLGKETLAYELKQDVLFYEGTEGVDDGLELRFDAYLPPKDRNDLPGNRSTLIRIHGGGWTIGDKGASNTAQVNKYFASQGYVVFDVQYGLSNVDKFVESAPVPEHIVGDFSIDDMVRHIGIFTRYLEENNAAFEANLDSVFVSGGSAGGQLANAVGLGLASNEYQDILSPALQVKGIIPVFPANGLSEGLGIDGSPELVDPSALVTENSPPALIFHGTEDGVVDPSVSKEFAATYDNNNNDAVLLMMPYAGHNGDWYFSSYYNQTFIYYMERFLYLNQ